MSRLRSVEERKADVQTALEQNRDLWLATASPTGSPHLIAVSAWWDGSQVVIATREGSATARNLEATRTGRLGLGSPEDVALIEVKLIDSSPAGEAPAEMREGFESAVGWNPAGQGGDWRFYRLAPVSAQAYRGYSELEGRHIMRDSRWLA